jgi:hypothetical protein
MNTSRQYCGRSSRQATAPTCQAVRNALVRLGGARHCAACLGLGLVFLLGGTMPRCAAQMRTQHEYEVKAGVLYHIIQYVEWPAESSTNSPAELQIGLLGQIPFAEALEVLDGKTIQGRKVVVRRLSTIQEAPSCQVVFIGASEKPRIPEIISGLKDQPILTVSEVEGFAEQGGMVNLLAGPNRVIMEINREVANQAHLSISSHLLKLAKVIPR